MFRTKFNIIICIALAFFLAACTPPVKPETPLQRLVQVDLQFSAVVAVLAEMVEAGRFTDGQVNEIIRVTESGNDALTAAHELADLSGADNLAKADLKIAVVKELLTVLRTYLTEVKDEQQPAPSAGSNTRLGIYFLAGQPSYRTS